MAVLIPPFLLPDFTGPRTGIKRIVICDLVVSLVAVGFSIYFVQSGLVMIPAIYWHTPLSNFMVYAGLIAGDFLLAMGVYWVMDRVGVLGEG